MNGASAKETGVLAGDHQFFLPPGVAENMAERALRLEGARAWFESNGSKFSCVPKIWRDEFIDSGIYPNDSIANQVFTDNQIRFEELLVVGVAKLGLSANGKRLTSTFNEVRAAYRDAAT